jgi:hypothetical protein
MALMRFLRWKGAHAGLSSAAWQEILVGMTKGSAACDEAWRQGGRTADPSATLGMTKERVVLWLAVLLVRRTADPSATLGMTKERVVLWLAVIAG